MKTNKSPTTQLELDKPSKAVPPKGMTSEELMKFISECLNDIKLHETFDNAEVLDRLKGISKTYFDYKSDRKKTSNHLTELGFPGEFILLLNYFLLFKVAQIFLYNPCVVRAIPNSKFALY